MAVILYEEGVRGLYFTPPSMAPFAGRGGGPNIPNTAARLLTFPLTASKNRSSFSHLPVAANPKRKREISPMAP